MADAFRVSKIPVITPFFKINIFLITWREKKDDFVALLESSRSLTEY